MAGRNEIEEWVGRHVRMHRTAAGLTQAQLAEAADLTVDTVSRIERGAQSATVGTVHALARALNVSHGALFGESAEGGGQLDPQLQRVIAPLVGRSSRLIKLAAALVSTLVERS